MLSFLILWSASLPEAWSSQDVASWVRGRPTPSAQRDQVVRFEGVSTDYASGLMRWSRGRLARSAAGAVGALQGGGCEESSTLTVLSAGFAGMPPDPASDRFERSVFELETTGCIPGATLAQAESVYNSEAFRTAEMPNLSALRRNGDQLCLQSAAVTGVMMATDFCMQSHRMAGADFTVTHNVLSGNNDAAGTAPMFFREEVIVFVQQDAGVGVYRRILTRGEDIGMAGRMVLQRTASMSQSRIYRALETWLQK
ncbi:MAG: hypothetical protein AAFV53_11025 [Myxococcota bacterium]